MKQKIGAVIPVKGVPIPINIENELSDKELKTMKNWNLQQQKLFNREMRNNMKAYKQQFQHKEGSLLDSIPKSRKKRQKELRSLKNQYKKKIVLSTKRLIKRVNDVKETPSVQRRMRQQHPYLYKHEKK